MDDRPLREWVVTIDAEDEDGKDFSITYPVYAPDAERACLYLEAIFKTTNPTAKIILSFATGGV